MGRYLLKNKEGIYFKSYNPTNETVSFTTSANQAKKYDNGEWFAQTELDFLKFHFEDKNDELKTMKVIYL